MYVGFDIIFGSEKIVFSFFSQLLNVCFIRLILKYKAYTLYDTCIDTTTI